MKLRLKQNGVKLLSENLNHTVYSAVQTLQSVFIFFSLAKMKLFSKSQPTLRIQVVKRNFHSSSTHI